RRGLAGAGAALRGDLRRQGLSRGRSDETGAERGLAAGPGVQDRRPAFRAAYAPAGARAAFASRLAEYHPQRVSSSPPEITCLIVDDHEVVREGLRLSLSRAPHIRVIGEASDGASAVALAERRRPNVVIMDVRMPGMDGLEATKILTEKVPESAVL